MKKVRSIVIFTDKHSDIPQSLNRNLGRGVTAKFVVFKAGASTCTVSRYVRGKVRWGKPVPSKSKSLTLSVDAIQKIVSGVSHAKTEFHVEWIVVVFDINAK